MIVENLAVKARFQVWISDVVYDVAHGAMRPDAVFIARGVGQCVTDLNQSDDATLLLITQLSITSRPDKVSLLMSGKQNSFLGKPKIAVAYHVNFKVANHKNRLRPTFL